jgi:hypothetical protein
LGAAVAMSLDLLGGSRGATQPPEPINAGERLFA